MGARRFSKRQKNHLWVESGGACEQCGVPLDPDRFHADHVRPWIKKGPTSVHNGAALCSSCNLQKGDRMLRKHQAQVKEICRAIANDRTSARTILADVHPGGGKSALPLIAAKELRGSKIDRVCWVVPRLSLQEQGETSSLDENLRGIIGHSFELRQSTNDRDPCRGLAGFVTTYQSVGTDSAGLLAAEFLRYRYLLVLDEPHHVIKGGSWAAALKPLMDRAAVRLLMTGTLSRDDQREIAFLPYGIDRKVDVADESLLFVQYTRTDALDERAIIPLHFVFANGKARWVDIKTGVTKSARLDECGDDDARYALRSALESEYAEALIKQAVSDWRGYRSGVFGGAKILLVAPSQAVANQYTRYLKSLGVQCAIATSDEGADAQARIRQFKTKELDALVTVGMAYEGLDVKAITHIVGLTHYRSTPWIEQMLNRATRFNPSQGPYEQQEAFAYVPADSEMMKVVERIREEQEQATKDKPPPIPSPDGPRDPKDPTILPLDSEMIGTRAAGLDGDCFTDYEEDSYIREIMRGVNIEGRVPTTTIAQILQFDREAKTRRDSKAASPDMPKTAKQREMDLRRKIAKRCRKLDEIRHDCTWGATNLAIVRKWNKRIPHMREDELRIVSDWLDRQFEARVG